MSGISQWLAAKGVLAAARVSAACGNDASRKILTEYDAQRLHRKTFRKVHEFAHLHNIGYREAAEQLGVPISQELLDAMRAFDPAFFDTQ